MTSCKTVSDKSVSEPLSNEEMVAICKDKNIDYLEKIITVIGSKESFYRKNGGSIFIKYADVTYGDVVDVWVFACDSVRQNEYKEKYKAYEKEMSDTIWNRLLNIRDCIVKDTSFNKYAKLHFELEEKTVKEFWSTSKTKKQVSMRIEDADSELNSLGGIVCKASKMDTGNALVKFNFFELAKGTSGFYFKQDPYLYSDTTDFTSEKFDYSVNILWIKKDGDKERIFTSKEYWDLLATSPLSIFANSKPQDHYFYRNVIKKDDDLLRITNSKIEEYGSFSDSLMMNELSERGRRAMSLIKEMSRH